MKKQTTAVTAGVIISLVLIVLALILYFSGLYISLKAGLVALAIFVGGIIWAVINHSREQDYSKSFSELFAFGFKVTAVITCVMIVYALLSSAIFPDIKNNVLAAQNEMELKQPAANEEFIKQNFELASKYYLVILIAKTTFSNLIFGLISSLIGAGVSRKRPKNQFEQI